MNQETEHQDKMAPSIDPSRIQPVETRPSIGSIKYLENVPIIDLAPLQLPHNSSTDEAKASIAKQVHNAFKEWGFFVAINHGVSPDLWSNLKMAMAGFSALPYEEKKKAARYVKNPWGFHDEDFTKNITDWCEVFDYMAERDELEVPENPDADCKETRIIKSMWPEKPEDYKKICHDFAQGCLKLMSQLMEVISLSLESLSYVRTNHYSSCNNPDLVLGKGAHRDPSAFTLLTTDEVVGLEAQRKSDGQWLRLRPIPNSCIIVAGDVLQNAIVKPLDELVDEDKNPAHYGEYKWDEYFVSRRTSNFIKLDKPVIEVADFKKSK
ncbi:hypothetical protein AMTRI_Chr13g124750 [Amborella trichopoda]